MGERDFKNFIVMAIKIERNIPLSKLTTFRVGGSAKYFVEVESKVAFLEAVKFAKDMKIPIFVLGGGSDVLLSDQGYKGLVLRYKAKDLKFIKKNNGVLVIADAGIVWDDLVKTCVGKGLQGIECLSGIPGSVGAAPIQNIGAYGQELRGTFTKLNAYDLIKNKFVTFDKKDCQFSYRESVFKKPENKGRYIITDITLKLKKNAPPTLTYKSLIDYLQEKKVKNPNLNKVREAVLDLRGQKLEDPKILGNAGSFFKNPIVNKENIDRLLKIYHDMPYYPNGEGGFKLFAGWLIDNAGWKGRKVGGAMVSTRNALVITNPNRKASAKEIKDLSEKIKADVQKKFGVTLEPEVQFIGFD